MRRILVVIALGLAILAMATPALGQAESSGVSIERIEDFDFPTVRVLVTAPPELHETDLGNAQWAVTEDGEPIQLTEVFRVGGEDIRVVLILDTSGSMAGEPLTAAVESAISFVDSVPSGTEVALVSFGSTVSTIFDFTDDLAAVRAGLNSLTASGETALYDAVLEAVSLFPDDDARRSVIILTDGGDTTSSASPTEAAIALTALRASVFAIEYETSETDSGPLAALTSPSGGKVIPAGADDVQLVYDDIAKRITSQYVLSYESTASGQTRVGVRVVSEGDVSPSVATVRFPILGHGGTTEPLLHLHVATSTTVPSTLVGAAPDVPLVATKAGDLGGPGRCLPRRLPPPPLPPPTRRPTTRSDRSPLLPYISPEGPRLDRPRSHQRADRALGRGSGWGLQRRLTAAGLNLRPGEYVVLVLIATVTLWAIGWASSGILAGLGLGAFGFFGGFVLLSFLATRRKAAFEAQLPEILDMLASTIRTGYAPLQATELVSRESRDPAKAELSRVVAEARLGSATSSTR